MLSQAIKSSINQINNQQSNFTLLQSSSPTPTPPPSSSTSSTIPIPINISVTSSSSSSSDHQNQQLYQQHQHIWQQQHSPPPPPEPSQQHQKHRYQRFPWHQYPKPETQSSTISIFSLVMNQYNPVKGANLHLHYNHHHLLTKLLQPTLRPSMNVLLLTILTLNLINQVPCTLATNLPDTTIGNNNVNTNSNNNNNFITNPYDIINSNINNVYEKDDTLNSNSLGNLEEEDFSLSSLTHSRPVFLSSSPELSLSSSTLLSQSKLYSPSSSSSSSAAASSSSSSLSSLASFPSPLSSSSAQPSSTEATSSPVSPGSYYSFISSSSSSPHHPTQLSHYYLQITKPKQSPQQSPQPSSSSSSSPTTSTTIPPQQQQSIYNNNNYNNNNNDDDANTNELNIRTPKDFESLFHRIARRSSRPYDVPQIECPVREDGVDRFACPTPNKEGRYRCIEDHELCNGFIACPNAEDEDRKLCMFYKTTKAHLDVLADAMLRMVRGRF